MVKLKAVLIIAKGKHEKWLTDNGIVLLKGWARDGLTDKQIAKNMGVAVSTLYDYKKKHPDISEALKEGKEVADYYIENALYAKAKSGDNLAMFYWLNNRLPEKWRTKPETKNMDEGVMKNVESILVSIKKTAQAEKADTDAD